MRTHQPYLNSTSQHRNSPLVTPRKVRLCVACRMLPETATASDFSFQVRSFHTQTPTPPTRRNASKGCLPWTTTRPLIIRVHLTVPSLFPVSLHGHDGVNVCSVVHINSEVHVMALKSTFWVLNVCVCLTASFAASPSGSVTVVTDPIPYQYDLFYLHASYAAYCATGAIDDW